MHGSHSSGPARDELCHARTDTARRHAARDGASLSGCRHRRAHGGRAASDPRSTHEPPASPTPADPRQLLISAVDNLQQAASFSLTANEVRAYRAIEPDGETRLVYGEFTTRYDVIRRPALKIRARHEYRYDPQAAFAAVEAYTYQRNGRYYSRLVEASGAGAEGETSLERTEPLAGDLPDTAHLL